MGLLDGAKGKLRDAVGEVADDSADDLRRALLGGVEELLQYQTEVLAAKAIATVVKAVHDEIHAFAALNLATKQDVARLEELLVSLAAAAPAGLGPAGLAAPVAPVGTEKASRARGTVTAAKAAAKTAAKKAALDASTSPRSGPRRSRAKV